MAAIAFESKGPSLLSTSKRRAEDWNIMLAFRRLDPDDSCSLIWTAWALACITCNPHTTLAHVDIVFRRACPGEDVCPYRETCMDGKSKAIKHEVGQEHIVSYGARDTASHSGVTCMLTQSFSTPGAWSFLARRAPQAQVDRTEAFLRAQVGCVYNKCGASCNMLPCCRHCNCCLCCCCLYGTTYTDARKKLDTDAATDKTWFCSELVSAALVHSLLINTAEIEPRETTPGTLYEFIASRRDLWWSIGQTKIREAV